MGENIVYMPTSFYDLRKIETAGYKEVEDNLSQHYSWAAIDLDTKTYKAVVGMTPESVIVSANTLTILELLRGMNREGMAWMKYGRDYIFSTSYYPEVLDVKKRLKGIREGINE